MFNSEENKNRTIKQYLSKALTVASHPTRREILKQFRNGKSLSAAELTDILNVDRYNLYHHLEILEKYSLIEKDNDLSIGKKIYYKMHIEEKPLMAAFSFNKEEIKENNKSIEKILDIVSEIENFKIPNRNKISMIEINVSYDYNEEK